MVKAKIDIQKALTLKTSSFLTVLLARETVRLFLRRKLAVSSGVIILIIIFVAIFASWLAPCNPLEQNLSETLRPPFWNKRGNWKHILGTDQFGRDVLSRIIYSARASLSIVIIASFLALIVGVILGLISGYYGGRLDNIIMRAVDTQLAFPSILLAITVVALLGPGQRNLVIVLIVTGWAIYARVIRGTVLSVKEREFVEAAKALGATDFAIIFRHIFPNVVTPIIVIMNLEIAHMILLESGLSFLGLGVPPPTPSWGRMLNEGRAYLIVAPWLVTSPGLLIMVMVLSINFLGDALRDVLDPKLRI